MSNSPNCDYVINENEEINKEYLDQLGNHYQIVTANGGIIEVKHNDGKSSSLNFVSGFEILINNWDELDSKDIELKKLVELIPDESGSLIESNCIKDTESELFLWLGFLDINVLIIVVLMLLIGIINI